MSNIHKTSQIVAHGNSGFQEELNSSNGKLETEPNMTTTNAKLDTIATNTANIKISTDSVNLNVDTLEALQTTSNAKLVEISAKSTDIDNSVKANAVTVAKLNQILTKNTEIDTVLDSCSAKLSDIDTQRRQQLPFYDLI